MEALRNVLVSTGQTHILDTFPDLNESHPIYHQLSKLNIASSLGYLEQAKAGTTAIPTDSIAPIDPVFVWNDFSAADKVSIEDVGKLAIRNGEVAAVIMSGGQGTRLGFAGPKGMYNIGLISGKSIFHLHMERLLKIRNLCATGLESSRPLPVYIMTSDLNYHEIRDYFITNNYFGYPSEDVFFFEQSLQPCIDLTGKIIIESETSLSLAPDGNGGIYHALQHSGAFANMVERGVKYLHVYGIDNVLTKSADPRFIGHCITQNAEVGNKVVWRAHKSEKVGVSACTGRRMCIIEYSEIPAHLAEAEDSNGKLIFGAANICNHFLTVAFLRDRVFPTIFNSYHLALKKIPYLDPETRQVVTPAKPNGNKLEMFIFDVFPLAESWTVLEIERRDEFAPVKNARGDPSDSPDTAVALISEQAIRWLLAAGADVVPPLPPVDGGSSGEPSHVSSAHCLCEISSTRSYCGEGLEEFSGQIVTLPFSLS